MPAPTIKFQLTEKQVEKFADLYSLDPMTVKAINSIACLNTEFIRDILIKEDYEQMTKGIRYIQTIKKQYIPKELIEVLARMYHLRPGDIMSVLKDTHNSHLLFCKECGVRITPAMNKRTGGLCSACLVNSWKL